ncbi:MAG: XTP/dITP diphosphatase [Eubacteriales bacterium]
MMKMVAATNNKGKLNELVSILSKLGIEVISLEESGYYEEIEENGKTFEENALIKAEAVMRVTGLAAIGDDSGLEIDALNGEPGIYSARYAKPGLRKKTVLDKLRGVPEEKRTARFVCAIACVLTNGEKIITRGICEGKILNECRGEGGFGYDPIFYVPEYRQTFAEMPTELKNRISHRARAIQLMAEKLKGRLKDAVI